MGIITIERNVLEKNDQVAQRNRDMLRAHGVFTCNLLSSPGAGKTLLLERILESIGAKRSIAVIEGDVQTTLDAERLERFGIPAVQIITRGGCHLDAPLVENALRQIDLTALDLLCIENVGNLVCPSGYDLGEDMKIVIASTTEGDDKPLKYPAAFRNASVLIINKTDLLPHVPCDMAALRGNALSVNPSLKVFETSAFTGAGIPELCGWLMEQSPRRE
jgi:hydrogenase nickel incorporation protein HypB